MSSSPSDRAVGITGATSGVGRATARRFGETGARVALPVRGGEELEGTREEIGLVAGLLAVVAGVGRYDG